MWYNLDPPVLDAESDGNEIFTEYYYTENFWSKMVNILGASYCMAHTGGSLLLRAIIMGSEPTLCCGEPISYGSYGIVSHSF